MCLYSSKTCFCSPESGLAMTNCHFTLNTVLYNKAYKCILDKECNAMHLLKHNVSKILTVYIIYWTATDGDACSTWSLGLYIQHNIRSSDP